LEDFYESIVITTVAKRIVAVTTVAVAMIAAATISAGQQPYITLGKMGCPQGNIMQSQLLPWVGSALFLTFLYHCSQMLFRKHRSMDAYHEDRALYFGIAFALVAIGAAAGVLK
jgi:uncharacterized membrane protein